MLNFLQISFYASVVFLISSFPTLSLAGDSATNDLIVAEAKQGVLNAVEWKFLEKELFLVGEWQVIWSELVNPNDFDQQYRGDVFALPNNWNNVANSGIVNSFGVATFRIKLKLPTHKQGLTFHIVSPNSAWRLYVDDQLLGGNGVVADNQSEYQAHYISRFFPAKDQTSTLTLQVANFSHAYGGPEYAIALWDKAKLNERLHFMSLWFVLALGVLSCVGLIHLIFYIADKKYRENGIVHFWFSVLCFILVVRISGVIPYFHLYTPESAYWSSLKIAYTTLFAAPAVYLLFFRSAFPQQFPDRLTKYLIWFSLGWTVFVLVTTENIYTQTRDFSIALNIFVIAYSLIFTITAKQQGEPGAGVILFSNFIFAFAAINDAIIYTQGGNGFDMTPFGIMVLGLGYSYALLQRLQETHRESRDNSKALEKLNLGLEEQVRDRTRSFKSAAAKAENSTREKTRFIAAARHDLRQPLAALGLFNVTLQRSTKNSKISPLLEEQGEAIRNLRTLLKDALDSSKSDSLQREPEFVELTVSKLLTSVCSGFKIRSDVQNIQFDSQFDTGTIVTDSAMLQRILSNLIDNALKAARSHILVTAQCKENAWIFEVSDDGSGINPSDTNKIFGFYVTIGDENQSEDNSYGLGLYVVKEFTKSLKGTIEVSETSTLGSTFTLTIGHRRQKN